MRIQPTNIQVLVPAQDESVSITKKSALGECLKDVSNGSEQLKSQKGAESGHQVADVSPESKELKTTIFENGLPAELHFIWEGKPIPQDRLANILLNASYAPDFKINIWTTDPTLITSTLHKMMDSETNAQFRFLAHNYGHAIVVKDTNKLYEELIPELNGYNQYNKNVTEGRYLASMFMRETNGVYKNYAAASDITRAVLMYLKGGCYMDVDTVCKSLKSLKDIEMPQQYLIGRDSVSIKKSVIFNAFLASVPRSPVSKGILQGMAIRLMGIKSEISDIMEDREKAVDSHVTSESVADSNAEINPPLKKEVETYKKASRLMWVNKRSNENTRFDETIKMTGPGLLVSLEVSFREGIFFDGDFYASKDKRPMDTDLVGKGEHWQNEIREKVKWKLYKKRDADGIFTSRLTHKFDGNSRWRKLRWINKDPSTF